MSTETAWRRLPSFDGPAVDLLTGAEGMIAGLASRGQPAIRWSVTDHPALLLGSSQHVSEADFAACAAHGTSVHRRRSGGTAVFADRDFLLLDVALPSGHALLPANVTETYRWLGEVWAAALAELGVEAHVIGVEEARATNAALDAEVRRVCFGGVSPYEVFVGERKIVGLAQIRRRPGGVLQAGIYMHWQPECVSGLLSGSSEERARRTALLAPRARGLRDVRVAAAGFEDVVRAFEAALRTTLHVSLLDDTWSDDEQAAMAAARERYMPIEAAEEALAAGQRQAL